MMRSCPRPLSSSMGKHDAEEAHMPRSRRRSRKAVRRNSWQSPLARLTGLSQRLLQNNRGRSRDVTDDLYRKVARPLLKEEGVRKTANGVGEIASSKR